MAEENCDFCSKLVNGEIDISDSEDVNVISSIVKLNKFIEENGIQVYDVNGEILELTLCKLLMRNPVCEMHFIKESVVNHYFSENQERWLFWSRQPYQIKNQIIKNFDFKNKNLRGVVFPLENIENIQNIDFSGSDLSGVDLSNMAITNCNFSDANFTGANLRKAYILNCNFSDANFTGANLSEAITIHTEFKNTTFKDANLTYTRINFLNSKNNINLTGANLTNSIITEISGMDLSGMDLSGAKLEMITIIDTDLTGTNLSGANLSNSNIINSNISDAYLSDTNLNNTVYMKYFRAKEIPIASLNLPGAIYKSKPKVVEKKWSERI